MPASYQGYPSPGKWGRSRNEDGSERRRIQGYRSPVYSGGLDEYNALQDRNIPAFPGGRSAVPSAGQFAEIAQSQGRQINPGGTFTPVGRASAQRTRQALPPYLDPNNDPFVSNPETPAANLPAPLPYSTAAGTPGNLNSPVGHADNMRDFRRGQLQQGADGIRLLRQSAGALPTVMPTAGGGAAIEGKYGRGSITAPGSPRQGLVINGRPGQEFFQGAADRQQAPNRFARPSSKEDIALWRKAFDRLS